MKILFIGGTGNISAECVELVCRRGHNVYILTRGHKPVPDNVRALHADRYDYSSMRQALSNSTFDVVVNFLGFTPAELKIDYELLRDRIGHYVFISSTVVYAKPLPELPVTEHTPLGNPFSEYAQNKIACETQLQQWHQRENFPVTIVRPSHTYSCSWIPNAVASGDYTFAARLERGKPVFVHDNGQSLWTLTAASDFAVGLAGLLGKKETVGETYHITSDEVLTWNQIYHEIARALGVSEPQAIQIPTGFICETEAKMTAKLLGDKAENGVFDNAKIKREVPDYQCRTNFRDGIRKSVEWFKAVPERQVINPEVDQIYDRVIAAWDVYNKK